MRIDTQSGLRGELVAYVADERHPGSGHAIVLRDDLRPEDRPSAYSTHLVYEGSDPATLYAESGHYDLTLAEARADLAERTGKP